MADVQETQLNRRRILSTGLKLAFIAPAILGAVSVQGVLAGSQPSKPKAKSPQPKAPSAPKAPSTPSAPSAPAAPAPAPTPAPAPAPTASVPSAASAPEAPAADEAPSAPDSPSTADTPSDPSDDETSALGEWAPIAV